MEKRTVSGEVVARGRGWGNPAPFLISFSPAPEDLSDPAYAGCAVADTLAAPTHPLECILFAGPCRGFAHAKGNVSLVTKIFYL